MRRSRLEEMSWPFPFGCCCCCCFCFSRVQQQQQPNGCVHRIADGATSGGEKCARRAAIVSLVSIGLSVETCHTRTDAIAVAGVSRFYAFTCRRPGTSVTSLPSGLIQRMSGRGLPVAAHSTTVPVVLAKSTRFGGSRRNTGPDSESSPRQAIAVENKG